MGEPENSPIGVVLYSPFAAQDLAEIHNFTTLIWGLEQAERYSDFLQAAANKALAHSNATRRVEDHPVARAIFAKWPKAKYGHFVVYRPTDYGIYVLRILHSAMNISEHLSD